MKLTIATISLGFVIGCGSSTDPDPASENGQDPPAPGTDPDGETPESAMEGDFDPPAAAEGYERIVAPVMEGLEPGADISYCQYVRGPLDRPLDILDFRGFQSVGGHHAVAYASTADVPVGYSGACSEEDNLQGTFLGGIGGESGSGAPLPEGVAFRLPAGTSIMLNTHFLNTTSETIDGETVVDIRFAEVDPNRKIATMFSNGHFTFEIPASGAMEVVTECEVPREMEIILFANHMHDYGSSAMTELERAATGETELIQEDPDWSYEMQFNANYRHWDLESPLEVHPGDVFRTHCSWNNDSAESLTFPREMCFGVGFFISDGTSSPVCANGEWIENAPTTSMP